MTFLSEERHRASIAETTSLAVTEASGAPVRIRSRAASTAERTASATNGRPCTSISGANSGDDNNVPTAGSC